MRLFKPGILNLFPGILSFFSALFLSLESYLNLGGKSLCHTSACEIVGQYIKIPESLLVALGAIYFWLLTLIFFYSVRGSKRFPKLPLLFLAPALIFDASLIGFQFFTIQKYCVICIITAIILVIVFSMYCATIQSKQLFLVLLLAWSGAFFGQAIQLMPAPANAYTEMALFKEKAPLKTTKQKIRTITLVFSMECPHCMKLIQYLSEHKIPSSRFQLAMVDQAPETLQKIATFLQQSSPDENIFKTIIKAKKNSDSVSSNNVKKIKKANKKALTFLANNSINTVPVLIVQTSAHERRIFTSSESALTFLLKEKQNIP